MFNEVINSNLDKLLDLELTKKKIVTGKDISIEDAMGEVADFCDIGIGTIQSYKDDKLIPSLPVALKLSEYFRVTVNDIFSIGTNTNRVIVKPVEVSNHSEGTCSIPDCGNKLYAKGLCQKHYKQERKRKLEIPEEKEEANLEQNEVKEEN
jgi:DNA-binding XRE family transcriptional regulator